MRSFLQNNDPKPVVATIKQTLKIYSYVPGSFGTSIATALEGKIQLAPAVEPAPMQFTEASGKAFNTIPPTDYGFFEMINALVQEEPVDALDPELTGQLAAIGIVKGKPFAPDARMKQILTEAAVVANSTARTLNMNPREEEGFAYYPGSAWWTMLFVGGYSFETPPLVTREGIKPFPSTGARTLNARTTFFHAYTGITPAMCMRLTGVGSQYLVAMLDANKHYFDGGKTYRLTLPKEIPEANFWSLTVYDNQTRSMLHTDQRFPKVSSLSYPRPAAVAKPDGSTTIYFSPKRASGVKDSNWIQTVPGKGYFVILRLYSPLEPFFEKTWRPSEIEAIK